MKLPLPSLPSAVKHPGRIRRYIYNVLMKTGGSVITSSGWVMMLAFPFLLSFETNHPRKYLLQLFCAIFFISGRLMIKFGRRLSAGYGWYAFLDSKNPLVIYLRSFADDRLSDSKELFRWPMFLWVSRTSEEKMVHALRSLGSVVAFGRPGDHLGPPGAARLTVSNEVWRNFIVSTLPSASLVVVLPGYTDNLRWELKHIRAKLDPQRVLLYVPREKRKQWVRYEGQAHATFYPDFLDDLLSSTIGGHYGRSHDNHNFIWFSPQWRYRPLAWIEETPSWHPNDWDSMAAELRPIFEHFGVNPKFNATFGVIKFFLVIVAGAGLAIFIARTLR